MKIEITNAIASKNPKSSYVVYMKYMHGDADAYTTESIGKFGADMTNKQGTLEELLELCERIKTSHLDTRSDDFYDILHTYPGYEKFYMEWPGDSTCDYQYPAEYEDHYVRYFDENGTEFEVKVTV